MKDKTNKVVILSIILFVFLFLFFSGTITSGYHFVDDHEVIKIKYDLKSSSVFTVSKNWVKEDLFNNGRFRPLYYIHRVLETKLLGSDFFLWSFYTGILCCLVMISFYLGIRNLKFALGESIAFLIITFIGPQWSVWWRLGPGESLGMVFLGVSFYFMSKSLNKRYFHLNNILFGFFLILSSLTKESFLLIIPAMIIFKIWNEKICFGSSLKELFYKNLILLVPLTVFAIELFIIKFYVGTAYSGLDTKLLNNVISILSTSFGFVKTYLNLIIVVLFLLIVSIYKKKHSIRFNLISFIFFLLIILPNIVLYEKSGLVERYLLPSTFGLGFLVATLIKGIKKDPIWFKKTALTLVLISFLPYMISSWREANKFSIEGNCTQKLLSAISKNYVNGSEVMVIVDPVGLYEKSVSLKTYLFYEEKIDLFGFVILKDENNIDYQQSVDGWKSYFNGRQYENMTSKPELLIFLDNQMVDDFFKKSQLLRNNYLQIEIGNSPYALLKENLGMAATIINYSAF